MSKALCAYCNLPVTEKDGTLYGGPFMDGDDTHYGYHYTCQDNMDVYVEDSTYAYLVAVESKYRGPGMW